MEPEDFEDGIPLPIGIELPRRMVNANSLMRIQMTDMTFVDTTESGWPTIITGVSDGQDIGIATDYPGWIHTDVPVEEVDLVLSEGEEEWTWMTVVAFNDKQAADESGRYHTHEYQGIEFVPWSEIDEELEAVWSRTQENITPVFYTEDHPEYQAHAVQTSANVGVLESMFGLDRFSTLMERRREVEHRVIPREERWKDQDTQFRDLARDLIGDDDEDDEDDEEDGAESAFDD